MQTLNTPRLTLRAWRATDLEPFAALNADPRVMEFMPAPLTRDESDAFAARIAAAPEDRRFGLWAVELRATGEFLGYVGLNVPSFQAHFTPCVEIGWRLAAPCWGRGFATEAARECLRFAFEELDLSEVVSFTVPENARSLAVMVRLGMSRAVDGDFDHPRLPHGHPLCRHVLYRLTQAAWRGRAGEFL
ncbi:MAG TPA: GNAT family N-acetyltransferase [Steroidobacteraceae bacterium]|nr:GNAT family N-acetyltransferase [Steroidobacteraceae bacterium]